MAMEPAAISARPARTTMWEEATAPERPAASANGTVRPSDRPMTTSRTDSEDSKWPSVWESWATSCMAGVYRTVGEKAPFALDRTRRDNARQKGTKLQDFPGRERLSSRESV